MNLEEAKEWLDNHINLEANAGRPAGASLERMYDIARLLGDPQTAFPAVHITGTNGKGSTARMVSRILQTAGLSVGTFTSPHLERINERISWNLEPIADDELARAFSAVAAIEDSLGAAPSHFEILTAAALYWFADIAVDVVVLEVGLLGRYDCTNIVDAQVAVLTRVAADHTDKSPGWKRAIAAEKAGIVKSGSTFVLGEDDPELMDIFDETEAETIWLRGRDFSVVENQIAVGGRMVDIQTPNALHEQLYLPLHGEHQADNAACAIAAAEAFFDKALEDDLLEEAFGELTVPGRLETIAYNPTVLLDAAHNPDGAESLSRTLADSFTVMGSRYLVMGLLTQQDTTEMLGALRAQDFDLVIICTPPSPRARPAEEVGEVARSLGIQVEVISDPIEAVGRAVSLAEEIDLVVVAGSIYVVGDVRAAYTRQAQAELLTKEAALVAEEESYFS